MIQLCNRSVKTICDDGTSEFFQFDILQKKIEESCIAAGLNASWIAEDIALSVEFTLGELGKDKLFSDSEIEAMVVKILQEAGLSSVASHFKLGLTDSESNVPFDTDNVKDIVERYLHLESPIIEFVVDKVVEAGRRLFLKNASPTLILELSKHYLDRSSIKDTSFLKKEKELRPWLVSEDEILGHISESTAKLMESRVIELSGISRLFPSIKIRIRFANFANSLGLNPPIPELLLFSYLESLAFSIDELIDTATEISSRLSNNQVDFPVYLMFSDAPEFTEKWLGGDWKENKECFEGLVSELKGLLTNSVLTYT